MDPDGDLTDFGQFCERLDIPVFDRPLAHEMWETNRSRFEAEEETLRRARASGFSGKQSKYRWAAR